MPEFAQVDVKEIKSNLPRSSFSEEDIDILANAILDSNGIIRPLILRQSSIDSYEVIEGHLEYYASVRAREKKPRQAEMANAFVITTTEEKSIRQQIRALKIDGTSDSTVSVDRQIREGDDRNNSDWISSFEKRLSDIREELLQSKRDNDSRISAIEDRFADQGDLMNLLNTLDLDKLTIRLSQYGISSYDKHAKAICEARKKKHFVDYRDVVKSVKGLGDKTMLAMIDGWSRVN